MVKLVKRKVLCIFILLIPFVFFLFGCMSLAPPVTSPVNRCLNYVRAERYKEALETIRNEIANPRHTSNKYLAKIREYAIYSLYHYVDFHGLEPGMDEEAKRYYEEGLKYSKGDEWTQERLNIKMQQYYTWTRRFGLAIPYIRKNLEYAKKFNKTYGLIVLYDSLASAYRYMGNLALEEHYRKKALGLAKDYFVWGVKPSKQHEWLNYGIVLLTTMVTLAELGRGDEILDLWGIMEPIVKKYKKPKYHSYLEVAEYMAVSGDIDKAMGLYEQAKKIAKKEGHWYAPADLACKGAHIYLCASDYETAAREAHRCIGLKFSIGQDPRPSTYRFVALIYEGTGDLDRAINSFRESIKRHERMRSSYSVTERATFFRSVARKSYWGLIRCFAKRALANKNEADFLSALQASELVRGRQFGELLGAGTGERITLESLKDLRNKLTLDEIILDYMFMDQEIVLFAFTKDRQAVFVLPYERGDFRRQVLTLVEDISTPSSNLPSLYQQLAVISHKILGPVRDMVKGKRRIVVLPDGILNSIPFDLLTLEETGYRPIIEDKRVVVAPSIRYLVRSQKQLPYRRAAGLFGLADPAYTRTPDIGGLSATEMRAVARGNKHLAYFKPLTETRSEVESIADMFKGEPVKKLFGASASESALKNANLLPYGYLHLATHGILGSDVPGINEPALVLAEERGEDGFFTASEAAELRLDAELAVLSACNTGTGEYFTGEGIMGMSRSFLLAGSKSVLVSLWSVPSKETEQLMVAFYKYLRAGIATPEAIRRAKLEMIGGRPSQMGEDVQEKRGITVKKGAQIIGHRIHPFYWAAFIFIGT